MPERPVHQMTTAELGEYKDALLAAMKGLSGESPALAALQVKMDMVLGEERSRERIAARRPSWPIGS